MSEKLQKVLARAGLGSRRALETWIEDGRVQVNGTVAKLGDRVAINDKVIVDGRPIKIQAEAECEQRVLIYHKPEGEVCSRNDPTGCKTVFENLPKVTNGRWVVVGRLDINTSGLLLFTTDGELANRVMHPSSQLERFYAVRVHGEMTLSHKKNLLKGVLLEDGVSKFESITDAGGQNTNNWYHVSLIGGKYREVRRLFESQNLNVNRLMRIRFGPVSLPSALRQGHWQEMTQDEVKELCSVISLPPKAHSGLYGRAARTSLNTPRKTAKSGPYRRKRH